MATRRDIGGRVSRGYKLAYRLGITPWESSGPTSGYATQVGALLDRERALGAHRSPALDMGCGTGDHSIEMVKRGWQVTGVDAVTAAINKARAKARAAGVDATFVVGDVARLPDSVGTGYQMVLDVGCFHGLSSHARIAYANQVTAITVPGACLLMFAFSPSIRGPLPRGASADSLERTFTQWHLTSHEAADTDGLAAPIKTANPRWFRLARV